MKVQNLDGELLNYWFARADGLEAKILSPGDKLYGFLVVDRQMCIAGSEATEKKMEPYFVGGGTAIAIMDRECISVYASMDEGKLMHWVAVPEKKQSGGRRGWIGEEPRIAVARAYVASKFGDEVPDL